jgi:hypothetical protein
MENNIIPTKKVNKQNLINTEFIGKYNNWSNHYLSQVQFEYERFLELRNQNENLSPSDSIDKFWHVHILDTKSYLNYCVSKFGKIIHHNPADSLDQPARKIRFGLTLIKYKEKFGSPVYREIWENSNLDNIANNKLTNTDHNSRPQLELPNYKEHLTNDLNIIKIFIFYTFDNGYSIPKETINNYLNNFKYKKWRPNNEPLDQKVISVKVSQTTTLDDLKKFISEKTGHSHIGIQIYPHPTWRKILDAKNKIETSSNNKNKLNSSLLNNFNSNGVPTFASNYLDITPDPITEKIRLDNLILKPGDNSFKFYIAELEELTSKGYC